MILFYLMIVGIIIISIIISVVVAYWLIKLLFPIGERYIFHFCNKPEKETRTKRQYAGDTINFIIFLKCIYDFLHLNNVWSSIRNAFRVSNIKSATYSVNSNKEYEGYYENNNRSPKPLFHNGDIVNDIPTKSKQNHIFRYLTAPGF